MYIQHHCSLQGCIPVIVTDGYVLPFSEVLDWSRASIRVHSHDLSKLFTTILSKISTEHETELRDQVRMSINIIVVDWSDSCVVLSKTCHSMCKKFT